MADRRRPKTQPATKRPAATISIIGPGNLARVLALGLQAAGYRIDQIVSRDNHSSRSRARGLARQVGARPALIENARLSSEVIWLCVSDDAIAPTAARLVSSSDWKGKIVLHSSGALTSMELEPLRRRGAAIGSLHPMQSFVRKSQALLRGVAFAVEGDPAAVRVARRIARDLGGSVFAIRPQAKVLYHAVGSFCSPMIVATLVTAEHIARAAGIPSAYTARVMHPILRQTIENYMANGSAAAFSGPLNRADIKTVRKHLQALGKVPGARQIYLALARMAMRSLPVRNRAAVKKVLDDFRS